MPYRLIFALVLELVFQYFQQMANLAILGFNFSYFLTIFMQLSQTSPLLHNIFQNLPHLNIVQGAINRQNRTDSLAALSKLVFFR